MLELRTRLRRLLRSPTYVVAVVLSLGLGTAVTLVAFSEANALVFKPLPGVTDRRNLIRVRWTSGATRLTNAEFQAMEPGELQSLSAIAAQGESPVPVVLPAGPELLSVSFVSPQLFAALGTQPVVGRLLGPGDAGAEAAPVALLSEGLWRRAFNGDPRVVGRSLVIGGRAFAIVGVTPEDFSGLRVMDVGDRESDYPQVWLRLRDAQLWPATARPNHPWLSLAGRLSARSTLKSAQAELDLVARRIAAAPPSRDSPDRRRSSFLSYRAGLEWRDEPSRSLLTMALFLFIPLSVLAIGCVNVINLQLARAMDDAGELSLRLALGASRTRILCLQVFDVMCLAAISGGIGVLGARILLMRASAYFPEPLAIDRSVLAFTIVLVAGVICVGGVLPAWQTSRDIVAAGLRELHDRSKRGVRLRGALVIVQVAASVTLLALSGLAIRSLLASAPAVGPAAPHILTADFDFRQVRPAAARSGLFVESVLENLSHASSIRSAAFSTVLTGGSALRYARMSDPPQVERVAYGGFVTSEWFATTGATFLAGDQTRHFAAGSAVVSSAFASMLGQGRTDGVIGTQLRLGPAQYVEIVGVVPDTQRTGDGAPLPMLFLPMPAIVPPTVSLVVRATDIAAARQAMRAAVSATDPAVPVGQLETLDVRISEASGGFRELASIAVSIGIVSIGLAGAGLHSLLSYIVRRRKREIGIRMALGARTSEIVWLVTAPALWLVSTGAIAGLAAAVPIAALIRSAFLGVSPTDARGLLPGIALLLLIAVVAAVGPIYHAARVDPIQSLREE
jgi:putative ABC transport system permease protein